ncbi:MAG: PTS glucose transporter subunit IIA, partial [Lachnospiraceae bacterium]|nr:PTS glucose transporter subunit IIA [Lachnospiraceae bacterium]
VSWILYKDEETEVKEETVETPATEPVKKEELVINPMNGEVKPLSQVPDDTFSSGVLGVGVAVEPVDGNLFAPVSGVVSTVFPTKHAIGITSETGAEILIHMGLNTVELDGKYFDCKVAEGDKVKAGDLISTWEIDEVRRAGYETITPIIVTNPDDFIDIVTSTQGNKIGETIINLARL